MIGDGILLYVAPDELLFVGRAPTVNWLQFHAETGGFKVDFIRDDRSPSHPNGKAVSRGHYRFQIQGPKAAEVLTKLNGRPLPDIKFFDLPIANYASSSYDVLKRGDEAVGFSIFTGYSHNERCGLSLGVVDGDVAEGEQLTLVWGEEGGGTRKPTIERHRQCNVRVKVGPVPFSRDARETYQSGWRTANG